MGKPARSCKSNAKRKISDFCPVGKGARGCMGCWSEMRCGVHEWCHMGWEECVGIHQRCCTGQRGLMAGGCGQHRLERVLKVYERCYTRGQGVWAGSVGKGCFGVMEVCKRSPTCQVRYGEVSQEESIGVRVV